MKAQDDAVKIVADATSKAVELVSHSSRDYLKRVVAGADDETMLEVIIFGLRGFDQKDRVRILSSASVFFGIEVKEL